MGELADDVRALGGYGAEAVRIRRIADEVEQLEHWRDSQFTGAAEPLGDHRGIGAKAFDVLRDQFNQLGELLDAAGCKTDRTPEAIIAALTRLADAEQRAAAAWAAVTELMQANGEITAIADVDEVSDRHDSSGWRCQLLLSNATNIPEFRRRKLRVAVIEPLSADRNPDLLERASVELAEAYQRAKAEEQRQAEQRQATGTPATTASVDKIAREFCAQIVENVKR